MRYFRNTEDCYGDNSVHAAKDPEALADEHRLNFAQWAKEQYGHLLEAPATETKEEWIADCERIMRQEFIDQLEEMVPCAYCHILLPKEIDETPLPDTDDDEAWDDLADYHMKGCIWIRTRSYSR